MPSSNVNKVLHTAGFAHHGTLQVQAVRGRREKSTISVGGVKQSHLEAVIII